MIWLVERDDNDWDEYDAFLVYARDEDEARLVAAKVAYSDYRDALKDDLAADRQGWMRAKVTAVPESGEGIILGSFRAG